MAPYNIFFGILILAIPLALAMPRYTETISFQVTSLEASSDDAYCGRGIRWPHRCWKYCGDLDDGQWCWIHPMFLCNKDSDCDSTAPCYSTCSIGEKLPRPELEFKELDAPHVRPAASQVTFEKPVTNAVKAVTPSGHFSSVSANAHSCPDQVTSLEARNDAHCGTNEWPHHCWRYCGDVGKWCWIQPNFHCMIGVGCEDSAPCSSVCNTGNKPPPFEVGNHRVSVKLLAA